MRLSEHPEATVLRMGGKRPPRRLALTDKERAALERARAICEQAAALLGETPEEPGDFLHAEARLSEVLM